MRLLFYFQSDSPFYRNLYYSIRQGFLDIGCEIDGEPVILSGKELREKIATFKPDFVLEINRTKSEIDDFPKEVIHVCWIFDLWARDVSIMYSDVIYTFGQHWATNFPEKSAKLIDYLPPATDIHTYKPLDIEKKYDFSFLGHIPKPWSEEELNREVGIKDGKPLFFKDIIPQLTEHFTSWDTGLALYKFERKHGFTFHKDLPQSLEYDIKGRIYRQVNRMHVLSLATNMSDNIVFYGTNWDLYEEYAPNYKGYLDTPEEINKAIQSAKIMLHDHHNIHFRILDAMANKTPVMLTSARRHSDDLEILGFTKDKDYLELDIFTKAPTKFPETQLKEMAEHAYENVIKNHLWVNRAKQIIDDIKNLKI